MILTPVSYIIHVCVNFLIYFTFYLAVDKEVPPPEEQEAPNAISIYPGGVLATFLARWEGGRGVGYPVLKGRNVRRVV